METRLKRLLEQRAYYVEILKNHNCKNYVNRVIKGFDKKIQELRKRIRGERERDSNPKGNT